MKDYLSQIQSLVQFYTAISCSRLHSIYCLRFTWYQSKGRNPKFSSAFKTFSHTSSQNLGSIVMANEGTHLSNPSNIAASSDSSKTDPLSHYCKSDISNPYFTHHSDHPGLILVSKSLNGDNYSGWKRAMTLALNSKNKLGFVNRSIEIPSEKTDPEGYATWSRCNDMVHSWIINTLNPEIADSVIYYPTAYEVWEDLQERFSQSNAPRIFEIQRDIVYL